VMLQAWLDHRAGTGQHASRSASRSAAPLDDLPPTPTEDPPSP
jgi:hypothetical protein